MSAFGTAVYAVLRMPGFNSRTSVQLERQAMSKYCVLSYMSEHNLDGRQTKVIFRERRTTPCSYQSAPLVRVPIDINVIFSDPRLVPSFARCSLQYKSPSPSPHPHLSVFNPLTNLSFFQQGSMERYSCLLYGVAVIFLRRWLVTAFLKTAKA
jgi:hypothetical protein